MILSVLDIRAYRIASINFYIVLRPKYFIGKKLYRIYSVITLITDIFFSFWEEFLDIPYSRYILSLSVSPKRVTGVSVSHHQHVTDRTFKRMLMVVFQLIANGITLSGWKVCTQPIRNRIEMKLPKESVTILKQVLPWNNAGCIVSAPLGTPYGITIGGRSPTPGGWFPIQ